MDLSYSQDRTDGFVVRITQLNREDPCFLGCKLMVYAKFRGFMGKVALTLHAIHDEWVRSLRQFKPQYRSLLTFENEIASDAFLNEARCDFEEAPNIDSEIDSMFVNLAAIRKLGYTALLVQGEGEQSPKKYVIHFNRMSDCERAVDLAQRARAESFGEFLVSEHRSLLCNQRLFLNDRRHLKCYAEIIRKNSEDFKDKVVLDVGCGLGTISLMAAQALVDCSPRVIYAVEPSSAAADANFVLKKDYNSHNIKFIFGRVESIELPSKVDIIISDNFGEMLLHGQLLRSLLIAKQRFLKADGKMYPAAASLILRPADVPEYDKQMQIDIRNWHNQQGNGRGLLSAHVGYRATSDRFARPLLREYFEDRRIGTLHEHKFDLANLTPEKLQQIEFPFSCTVLKEAVVRAFAFTFRLSFNGVESEKILDTENDDEAHRWQTVFCLLHSPLSAHANEVIKGTCHLSANEYHSYDIEIKVHFRRKYYENNYRLEYGSSIVKNI